MAEQPESADASGPEAVVVDAQDPDPDPSPEAEADPDPDPDPGPEAETGTGADPLSGSGAEPAEAGNADDAGSLERPEAVTVAVEVAPPGEGDGDGDDGDRPPAEIREYARFSKMDGATYERVNGFLRDRTYITAREWAIARLCADFRTETGVEMTKIGEHLPDLVPFMTDTYSPQAVNQARHSFEEKITKAGATFLYGAMCDFFTAEELDDLMYEVSEVAKFLLEVEGAELSVDEELEAEERIMEVMREVRHSSRDLREEEVGRGPERCPACGHSLTDVEG